MIEDSNSTRLPGFTRFSIEAGYLLGTIIGIVGCLLLWEAREELDYLFGSAILTIALTIQVACHKALVQKYTLYFNKLGQGLIILVGLFFLFLSPWSMTVRILLSAPCFGLSYYLYREISGAQKIWYCVSLFLTIIGFSFLFTIIYMGNTNRWIPGLYLITSCIISYGIRLKKYLQKSKLPVGVFDDLEDLWNRGHLFEIFGLSSDFTKLTLAQKSAEREHDFRNFPKFKEILEKAYEILQVNETLELYKKSRQIMEVVKKTVGERKFRKKEKRVWKELWTEIEKEYPLQPEMLTDNEKWKLVDKYVRKI